MSKALISKRYAEALFQLAEEKHILEAMESELMIVKEVFQNNPDFILFLDNPGLEGNDKKQLIDQAFTDFSTEVVNTLKLLVDRHHEEVVIDMVDAFINLFDEARGIKQATVYSVRELSDEEKTQLANVFQAKLHIAKLKINNVIEPDIIGGVKLRIGNTIYDGSVKGKLEQFEKNIAVTN
ncbi:ATP synthase subunit delta [Paraliobacillus sp. PM-2]|uniref:F0F1 ATP synthase subunit delta n=1 Tax=Paraliobacillus sp. PM-2 TaxID=1462524 RepID=UPI00061C262A|nr:F0F1 ATP synthase subunit delta [Paraliobacillus sp. PM-2]CQR46166.1 ATP synthase subunit delta [Paraliobacillus sp. PM-2]